MGRLHQAQVALVAVACASRDRAPPPPPPAVVHDPTIAGLPRLDGGPAGISAAIVDQFGAATARSCGVLDHADPPAPEIAQACVRIALAARQPFVVEEVRSGTDSGVGQALVGIVDGTGFSVYGAFYDSDPCGGGCNARGGTDIFRCPSLPIWSACGDAAVVECFDCRLADDAVIDSWHTGDRTRPDVAALAHQLIGPSPASVGPWLAGIRLGRPPAESDNVLARAAASTKLVAFETDADRRQLLRVRANVPGRCTTFRAQLAATWGPSRDDTWLDPATHVRAHLDRKGCALQLDRYADVAAWIARTPDAVVPLALLGAPVAAIRMRSSRDDDTLEWDDVGLGRLGGPVRVSATAHNGRIVELAASGVTDAATTDELRAHMVALLGKPHQDDTINDGATRYTAWNGADLSVGVGGGAFELSVSLP